MDRLAVSSYAATVLGHPRGLVLGLPDPPANGLAADHLGHHDRVVGRSLDEVLGAVDRVDGEAVLGRAESRHQVARAVVGLLPQHDRIGIGLEQRAGDQLLGLVVGHRDEVTGLLLVDLRLRQRAEPRHDHLGGDRLEQLEDCLGREGHVSGRG